MNTQKTYTFGFPDGNPLYFLKEEKEHQAFENFLQKILTQDQLETREQMRRIESAVKIVVDEIMEAYEK